MKYLQPYKIFEFREDYESLWDNMQYDEMIEFINKYNLPERLESTEWKYVDTKTQNIFKRYINKNKDVLYM